MHSTFGSRKAATALTIASGLIAGGLAAATTAFWPELSRGLPMMAAYTLTTVNACLALAPLAIGRAKGKLDLFEPPVVIGLIWIFAYVIPSIAILLGEDLVWLQMGNRVKSDATQLLAQALAMSALGLAAFEIAYYLPLARVAQKHLHARPRWELSSIRFRRWSFAMGLVALGMFAILIVAVGGIGVLLTRLNDRVRLLSGLNYLSIPAMSLLSILMMSYARWIGNGERKGRIALVALAVLGFGTNMLLGSKTNVFSIVVALLVTRHYLYRRVTLVSSIVLGACVVALAMAFDLFFREYLVIKEVASLNLNAPPAEVARLAWFAFSSNAFLQLQTLMLILDGVPDLLPFQFGRPYLAMALIVIPRGLYPSKPPILTEIFSSAYFPDLLAGGTSIPTSMIGEFYINFGALGVLVGSIILGLLLRRVYLRLNQSLREPGVVSIYALVIATLLPWIRGDSFGPTVFFLSVAIPIWLLVRLSRRTSTGER